MQYSRTKKFGTGEDGGPPLLLKVATTVALGLLMAVTMMVALAPAAALAAPAATQHSQADHRTYVVRQGDTLSAIALRFGITQDALMRANNIRNPNVVYVGQVLVIPGGHVPVPPPEPVRPETYVVRHGDTLGDIAKRFNTTIHALMQANNLRNANHIEVGQVLRIPAQGGKDPVYPPVTPPGKEPVYQPPGCCPSAQPPVVKPPVVYPPVTPPSKEPVYKPPVVYPPVTPPSKEPVYQPPACCPPAQPPVVKPPVVYPPVTPPSKEPVYQPPGCCPPAGHPPVGHPPVHRPEPPAKATGHWVGSYYSGKYFDHLVEVRNDPEIRFNWYTGSPAGLPEDRFSIKWERSEHFKAGWYRFYALADDGVRVYVDGTLIIDGWHIQPATQYTADVYLTGGIHQLQVDYFEESDHAQIHVYWEALSGQPPVIKR